LTKAKQHFSNNTVQNITNDHRSKPSKNLYIKPGELEVRMLSFCQLEQRIGIFIRLKCSNIYWVASAVGIWCIYFRYQVD